MPPPQGADHEIVPPVAVVVTNTGHRLTEPVVRGCSEHGDVGLVVRSRPTELHVGLSRVDGHLVVERDTDAHVVAWATPMAHFAGLFRVTDRRHLSPVRRFRHR